MNKKDKVLLLNPPGRHVYLRDYFCSKVSQADYVNHPIDLVYLSGILKDSVELFLIDAIVEKLDIATCLQRIGQIEPEFIVGLIGSVSYAEDVPFYKRVANETGAQVVLIGDILIENRVKRLQSLPFVKAFLHDFSTDDLLKFLENGASEASAPKNMTIRKNGMVLSTPVERTKEELNLPLPKHELFLDKNYRYPFVRRKRFATIMTEYGCPYSCTFCIMSTLGWKIRPVQNVIAELDLLKTLEVRELFFLDQTFGIQKDRAYELLDAMSSRRYDFGWVCFSRPDVVNDKLLRSMKTAGCHTIMLGLESGNEEILRFTKKAYDKAEVKAGFKLCETHGIRTVATVMLGMPQETQETFDETMTFLKEIDPDFASFNVAVPRMGTPFRKTALELGLADPDGDIMDQSGREVNMPSLALSRQQIAALKRKAIREFYFNLRYLKKRLTSLGFLESGSWSIQLRQGMHLLRNYFSY